MRERDLIRTAESIADDLDAKLRAMPIRRDEPTASDYREGIRDGLLFAFSAIAVLYGLLSIGGM